MKNEWIVDGTQMDTIAEIVLQQHPEIITLSGSLGAGKTTLVQHILKRLGVTDPVQSPTYAYVTTYVGTEGLSIAHFDLYRLRNVDDFRAAGFEEYLYQPHSLCLIEWPEHIDLLLKERVCRLYLEYESSEKRKITLLY